MKKTIKRIIASLLVAVMLFGSAPIESLTGINRYGLLNLNVYAADDKANPVFPVEKTSNLYVITYGGSVSYYQNGQEDYTDGHYGTDYRAIDISGTGATNGTTVRAVEDGVVVRVRSSDGSVYIKHTKILVLYDNSRAYSTWYTIYAHMKNISVKTGDTVSRGAKIGEVGNTGTGNTGTKNSHLHFSITTKLCNGNDGFNYNFKYYGAQDYATLKSYANKTISPMWINDTYRSVNYRAYSGDIADASALKRITGGTENAPPSTAEIISKPAKPVISADKTGDIAIGSKVLYKWSAVSGATGYKVYLNEKAYDIGNKTSYDFNATAEGSYNVYVVAYNSNYNSEKSNVISVKVHRDSKVTFVDWDGTVLETKNVKYGENAISPDTPTREGYTFIGWDKTLNKITEDTVITAKYKINKYTIKFLDYDERVLSTQVVEYGSDVVPPEVVDAPIGYEFFKWDSTKYLAVNGNAIIKGIYVWANEELPIVANITSAKRQEDGYYVYFDLVNYPTKITRGRAVVTLKTAEGKLVETTESAAFSIPAGATKKQMEVFIPCDESASIVEIIVVDSYSTGVPISEMADSAVDQGLAWSDWSDTAPAAGTYTDLETRTVYRYRDKEFSTSSSSTKTGWTQYNSTWVWSSYGSWSAWSTTQYTSSETRQIESKEVTDVAGYYQYRYWGFRNGNGRIHFCPVQAKNIWGGTWSEYSSGWVTTDVGGSSIGQTHGYSNCSCGMSSGQIAYEYKYNGKTYYHKASQYVNPVKHTEYRYRDRSKVYTYYFYRWLDWSDWSTEPVTATDNRQVDTPKTQYRFRNEFDDAGMEDTTGINRTASTNSAGLSDDDIILPGFPELAGKEITLFIYKIDEASDWTNEFVGQTVIAADGSYSFNFKLREEPSTKTGDFTVAVGIEGTTNTIVVGTIEAPQNKYTVIFRNWDGSIIDTQIVEEGKAAAVPEVNPSREGYDFAGWSSSVSNVQADLDIEPRFIKRTYTVVFVDWTTEKIVTKQFEHGDILMPPDVDKTEGYTLVGWSGVTEGETVVTENMIVTAMYDAATYEVNVYDFDMNIIGTYTVEHGDYAELPNEIEKSKYIFLGWKDADDKDTSCVTSNLNVYPIFVFEDTVETPVANVKTGTYSENQVVELSCATEDSVIYYTTDGTDPLTSLTQMLYEKPIEITRSTELKFVASAFEMNDSAVVSEIYAINSDTSTSGWMLYRDIPEYVLKNPSDYSLESYIGYRYKNVVKTATTSEIERLENEGWTNVGFEYGEQSGYQLTRPEFVDLEYEVIEKKPPQVEETHYQYTHFKYYDNATETYMYAPAVIDGVDGITEEYISPSRFQITGFVAGTEIPEYSHNGEKWYNQKSVPVMVDPGYMMYAYKLKIYTLTKWTEWSTDAPLAGETRETESETVYRFINPEMCIVTLVDEFEGTNDISMLGIVGKTLSEIDIDSLVQVGYNFDGFYTDADFANKWNYESDILSGDLTLYIKQSLKKFTVNFIDADGTLLDTQIVESGSEATPPEVETEQGYVFVGWDSSAYLYITEDIDIKAIVKHESEIVKIRLSRSKFTTTVGSAFSLTATVGPETIEDKSVVWSSSDYSVADVNSEGIVMALSGGKATITATAFDGTSASCVVTVLGNPDNELTLSSSSSLVVDSSGYLRNISIFTDESLGTHTAETVASIKNHFVNDSIVVVDINGETLADEDSVGTGSVVMLMDGETVIDSITIVITGDYDGNGSINNRDAAKITRYLVDKEEANLYQMVAIDVNGDGYVNNRDASMISRYLVGKETL